MELSVAIGQRINEVRGSMSQAAFSKKLNVTQSTIGRYERGVRSPDAEFILLLKEHFDINPNWLITGINPKFMQNGLSIPIYKDKPLASEDNNLTAIEHCDLVKEFQDQDRAKKINHNLVKIEKQNKQAFRDIDNYIEGIANGLKYHRQAQSAPDESEDQEKKVSGSPKNGTNNI